LKKSDFSCQAEASLVYLENRSLSDCLQENYSASDNPMALQVKKVAGKKADRGF